MQIALPSRILLASIALGLLAFFVVSAGGPDGTEDCAEYDSSETYDFSEYLDNQTAKIDCLEDSSAQDNAAWLTLGGFVAVGAAGAFIVGQRPGTP